VSAHLSIVLLPNKPALELTVTTGLVLIALFAFALMAAACEIPLETNTAGFAPAVLRIVPLFPATVITES
jgi:hypothetical protein